MRRPKHKWRMFYGWRLVPVFKKSDIVITDAKPAIIGYRRQFTHQSGALLQGAIRGTHRAGALYIVWNDHTLRKITQKAYDMLATVPPITRVPMLKGEKTLAKSK